MYKRQLQFLDTNGKPYNGDELRAVLDADEKSGQTQKIQLHYFTATFYKKGTCHIEFTNTGQPAFSTPARSNDRNRR